MNSSSGSGGKGCRIHRCRASGTLSWTSHVTRYGALGNRRSRPKEYALLVALLKRGGRVASRFELLREVWGYAEDVLSRTVDTHVAMLRRKLEHDPAHPRHIVTVRTFGYRIER